MGEISEKLFGDRTMGMKKISLFTLILMSLSFFAFSSQNAKKVAIVKIKRGMATAISPDGSKSEIKKGMWLKEGAIVKTGEKSFVKLSFIDKSSMNVGPKSELKIEKFSKDDAGVINVLTGKIRSKVTKDYLNMDKNKSKLFVKSKSAVMGIRGTEFMFATNKKTGATTAVLFEGKVLFNKINKGDNLGNLESIVDKGRPIKPGQFSVTMKGKSKPTVPSKMSSKQFNGLVKNAEFKEAQKDKVSSQTKKSIVPPGLSGDIVMGDSETLKQELQKVVKVDVASKETEIVSKEEQQQAMEESKGFVAGDDVKPADGSPIDLDTGTVIPLGADSTFDPNTGEWVSNSVGTIDSATGEYLPPEGYQITESGEMLVTDTTTGEVKEVQLEIKPVDETQPLDEIETVTYIAPSDDPVLADGTDPIVNPDGTEPVEGDGDIDGPEPASTDDPSGEEILPPPPQPGDCSTCSQPTNVFQETTSGSTTTTTAPTRSRVKINVSK